MLAVLRPKKWVRDGSAPHWTSSVILSCHRFSLASAIALAFSWWSQLAAAIPESHPHSPVPRAVRRGWAGASLLLSAGIFPDSPDVSLAKFSHSWFQTECAPPKCLCRHLNSQSDGLGGRAFGRSLGLDEATKCRVICMTGTQ